MADRAAQRLSLLPVFQEKEAAGGSSRGRTNHIGWLGRMCSASSCLLPSCTMLGKALWEIWQLFLNRLEITWCSSPGGPGKHFTEPLGPAQKGHSQTAFVSGFGAGSSLPSLENRQREQVILQKGEKKIQAVWQVPTGVSEARQAFWSNTEAVNTHTITLWSKTRLLL